MEERLRLVPFDRAILDRSWTWLSDPELKRLTMTPDFTREEQLRFFDALPRRRDYLVWGVELPGEGPIGVAGLKHLDPPGAEYWGYIGEKWHWGRGLGKQMLSLVEQEARSRGLTRLRLRVARDNPRAIRLYERQGWAVTGGDGEALFMAKALDR